MSSNPVIGKVYNSSTSDNIIIRLRKNVDIEDVILGGYLTIKGKKFNYICKIVEIKSRELEKDSTDIQMQIGELKDRGLVVGELPLMLKGGYAYEILVVIIRMISEDGVAMEAKTLPPIYAPVYRTTNFDVEQLYYHDIDRYVTIGYLQGIIGEQVPVRINLNRLMELHGGIFAKTGSGKTVLAKIIAGHIIAKENKSILIFDMHGEYGYKSGGLKGFFDDKVRVLGLKDDTDVKSIDATLQIPRSNVTVDDIKVGVELSSAQERAVDVIAEFYGMHTWFDKLMSTPAEVILNELGGKGGLQIDTIRIAKTNIKRFFDNLPFITPSNKLDANDSTKNILDWLIGGISVIVSFGVYSNDSKVYAVATNMISRRLLELYRQQFERSNTNIPNVIILLEEAHKFLNRNHLNSTFFGSFVREARKFKLGLFLVDQSPSKLHEEVMSQLGSMFIMQLANEKDKKMVIEQSEENIKQYKDEITRLNPREGFVVGKTSDFMQSFKVLDYYDRENMEKIWGISDNLNNMAEIEEDEETLGGF